MTESEKINTNRWTGYAMLCFIGKNHRSSEGHLLLYYVEQSLLLS